MNESARDRSDFRPIAAYRVALYGRVQGVGFRPAIARLAQALRLAGWVRNTREGIEAHVQGLRANAECFVERCSGICPPAGAILGKSVQSAVPDRYGDFRIEQDSPSGALSTPVPLDLVVCSDCLADVEDEANRRTGYVFTSCTCCGPRYSIVDSMPFERSATTMRHFALCVQCAKEYASPLDRRFHAQTTACAHCGPAERGLGKAIAALDAGQIVALKGLGGYQLLVDATNADAVGRLRQCKPRPRKPFAVLVADMNAARRLADLSAAECDALASPMGPIVVARLRTHGIVANVAQDLATVGLLLPTTPLHRWLAARCGPLVATSGNREGEPLAFEEVAAERELASMVDVFVHHDRPIRRPVDDSVVRVMAGRPVALRLGRGLAPLSLPIPAAEAGAEGTQVLAVGAHQKVALALSNGRQAVLGPHIGDLDSVAARQRFVDQTDDLLSLYGATPAVVVHDRHPDYFTTNWALAWTNLRQLRTIAVQHHHAHIAAGMVEHGWLSREVLGVAWDGTGLGPDGTIWGGEFLLATATSFQRVASLRPFRLPGGEAAIREPWRVAASLLRDVRAWDPSLTFEVPKEPAVRALLDNASFSPITSSAGRLFDAVAAMILPRELVCDGQVDYEGQFAMLFEDACNEEADGAYSFPLSEPVRLANVDQRTVDHAPRILDWRPLVANTLHDLLRGVPVGVIAMRFHRSVAVGIAAACGCFESRPVVLSGGVFQNRVLLELLAKEFAGRRAPVGFPGAIPPNDGGLAAGQLAIGLATLEAERPCA